MNNSAQLQERELQLLVLFLLIILECIFQQHWNVLPVFIFKENCEFGEKIHSKFVKPWEMKNLPWPWERHWNCVTHGETVRVKRSAFGILQQWNCSKCSGWFILISIMALNEVAKSRVDWNLGLFLSIIENALNALQHYYWELLVKTRLY